MLPTVSMKAGTDDTLIGLAIPYGGPFLVNGQPSDLHGERFSEKTELCLDWYESRPLLYAHGRGEAGTDVVGRVTAWEKSADGVWADMVLDRSSEYFETLRKLISEKKLYLSSGAMAHLVDADKAGNITRWPWVELSLTEQPANLLARIDEPTAERHFKDAGLRAVWSAAMVNDLPDSAFLYIEPGQDKDDDGKTTPRSARHFPVYDAEGKLDLPHLRNAIARIPQSNAPGLTAAKKAALQDKARSMLEKAQGAKMLPDGPVPVMGEHGGPPDGSYEALGYHIMHALYAQHLDASLMATFPGYVLVCVWEGNEREHYQIEYTVDESGMPILGEMREVEQVYVPVEMSPAEEGPMAMASARMIDFATSLRQRTQDLAERRAKEHRTLSAESRQTIARAVDATDAALRDVRVLLADDDGAQARPSSDVIRARIALAKSRFALAGLL